MAGTTTPPADGTANLVVSGRKAGVAFQMAFAFPLAGGEGTVSGTLGLAEGDVLEIIRRHRGRGAEHRLRGSRPEPCRRWQRRRPRRRPRWRLRRRRRVHRHTPGQHGQRQRLHRRPALWLLGGPSRPPALREGRTGGDPDAGEGVVQPGSQSVPGDEPPPGGRRATADAVLPLVRAGQLGVVPARDALGAHADEAALARLAA